MQEKWDLKSRFSVSDSPGDYLLVIELRLIKDIVVGSPLRVNLLKVRRLGALNGGSPPELVTR